MSFKTQKENYMENIPNEVRAYQQQFWAKEKAKEAARLAEKKVNPKQQARIEAMLKKPMRAREYESFARSYGATCEGGRGRHGVHIVLSNGQERPVPKHSGTLSPGVQRNLVSALKQSRN